MTQEHDHPITPPRELMQQWIADSPKVPIAHGEYIATQAARWGADQELEACCKLLNGASIVPPDSATTYPEDVFAARKRVAKLRAARRPKPPSLKEQALQSLDCLCVNHTKATAHENIIRRAIESLPS